MRVMIEMRSDCWREVMLKLKEIGFLASGEPEEMCHATYLVSGELPQKSFDACAAMSGVVGIWSDPRISGLSPLGLVKR